jgi:hypothetical protein
MSKNKPKQGHAELYTAPSPRRHKGQADQEVTPWSAGAIISESLQPPLDSEMPRDTLNNRL